MDKVLVLAAREFLDIVNGNSREGGKEIVDSILDNYREMVIEDLTWKVLDYDNEMFQSDFLTELCGYNVPIGVVECTLEEFAALNEQYEKIAQSQHWFDCVGCGENLKDGSKNTSSLDNKSYLCDSCFSEEWDLNKRIDPKSQLMQTIRSLPEDEVEKMIEATIELAYDVTLQISDTDFMSVINEFSMMRIKAIEQMENGHDRSHVRALYMEAFMIAYIMGYGMGTVDADRKKEG